jgi:hypothetical protein
MAAPNAVAAAPTAAQAIIGVTALTAGVVASTYVKPDQVVDYTIAKVRKQQTESDLGLESQVPSHINSGYANPILIAAVLPVFPSCSRLVIMLFSFITKIKTSNPVPPLRVFSRVPAAQSRK